MVQAILETVIKAVSKSKKAKCLAALTGALVLLFSALPSQIHVLLCFDACTGSVGWTAEAHEDCSDAIACDQDNFVQHNEHEHDHHGHDHDSDHHSSDVVLVGNDAPISKKDGCDATLILAAGPVLFVIKAISLFPADPAVGPLRDLQAQAPPPPDSSGLAPIQILI